MLIRLLSLVAAVSFSVPVWANTTAPLNDPATKMKQIVACGEEKAAKHIILTVPLALAAALNSSIADQLKPYEEIMSTATTCSSFDAAYDILVEVAKKNGTDVEAYFASAEGKQALQEFIAELRKLK
jgi:hypothetical protein